MTGYLVQTRNAHGADSVGRWSDQNPCDPATGSAIPLSEEEADRMVEFLLRCGAEVRVVAEEVAE